MRYFTYQRISTEKQELTRQEFAIDEYCIKNGIIVDDCNKFSDIITGKTFKRENYQLMKSKLQKEDCLIILDLDRLGRNWELIKNEWKELMEIGIYIIVINFPIISVLPNQINQISIDKKLIQELMFSILCYVSQKEVEKISERTKEALKAKKSQGIVLGKPKTKLEQNIINKIIELKKQGNNVLKISKSLNIGYRIVKRIITEYLQK